MEKVRVLYISQEITPFLPENEVSSMVRNLSQGIQQAGKEIRVFMPRYGVINERRHQLHEVIRLSGMNLVIDDMDHPLIIKVASIPAAKMQVYFIDNEEYFKRKSVLTDEKGKYFKDNDERSMFFCRGVLETVKKLGWKPDVIHCHGWMTGMMPLYIKKQYADDPHFSDAKVIYSGYQSDFDGSFDARTAEKLVMEGFDEEDVKLLEDPSFTTINKIATEYADAVVFGSETINADVDKLFMESGKPILDYQGEENYVQAYSDFYDSVLEDSVVLAE